jgi:uncharacterized membrane protein
MIIVAITLHVWLSFNFSPTTSKTEIGLLSVICYFIKSVSSKKIAHVSVHKVVYLSKQNLMLL